MDWCTIKTAPKDGKPVFVYWPTGQHGFMAALASYDEESWWYQIGPLEAKRCKPTHWMPLPEPPEQKEPA